MQTEKMAAMCKLAAGVAHEINNPAGVLLMKLKFLLSIADPEGLSARAVSTLKVAVEQTERIERIVESPLDFSRPADGAARRVDINDVVSSALQLARSRPAGGPTLTWEPGVDLPAVDVDPNEIEQVLINLIDNASTPRGLRGGSSSGTGAAAGEVTVFVADDGGDSRRFPRAHLRSLFHHEAGRRGYRAWPGDLLRYRAEVWRHHRC